MNQEVMIYIQSDSVYPFRLLTKRIGNLYVGSLREPFGYLKKLTKEVMSLDGKIIECKWDEGWVFMRERTDKSFPNAFTTAKGTDSQDVLLYGCMQC